MNSEHESNYVFKVLKRVEEPEKRGKKKGDEFLRLKFI